MKKKELLKALQEMLEKGELQDSTLIIKVEAADARVIEQWSEKLEKKDDDDPMTDIHRGTDEHMDSATHMGGHKRVYHGAFSGVDDDDLADMHEHIHDAAKQGHKIHVTHHKESGMYHVSSWKSKKKK